MVHVFISLIMQPVLFIHQAHVTCKYTVACKINQVITERHFQLRETPVIFCLFGCWDVNHWLWDDEIKHGAESSLIYKHLEKFELGLTGFSLNLVLYLGRLMIVCRHPSVEHPPKVWMFGSSISGYCIPKGKTLY